MDPELDCQVRAVWASLAEMRLLDRGKFRVVTEM